MWAPKFLSFITFICDGAHIQREKEIKEMRLSPQCMDGYGRNSPSATAFHAASILWTHTSHTLLSLSPAASHKVVSGRKAFIFFLLLHSLYCVTKNKEKNRSASKESLSGKENNLCAFSGWPISLLALAFIGHPGIAHRHFLFSFSLVTPHKILYWRDQERK